MIEVKQKIEIPNEIKDFPKLMKGGISGCIVLFSRPYEGVLIHNGPVTLDPPVSIGEYYTEWNEQTFEDYNEEIILSNK